MVGISLKQCFFALLLALSVACGLTGGALAAPAATVDAPQAGVSQESLSDLVKTIEDEQSRQKLTEQLRALMAARAGESAAPVEKKGMTKALDAISGQIDRLSGQLTAAASVVLDLPRAFSWVMDQLTHTETRAVWLDIGLRLLLVVLAGVIAEKLAQFLLARPRRAVEDRSADTLLVRITLMVVRTALDIVPIVAFGAAAYGALRVAEANETTQQVAMAVIYANVLARAAMAVARMVLAPKVTALRLLPLGDEAANYMFLWLRRLTNVAIYGYFIAVASLAFYAGPDGYALLLKIMGLVLSTMLIILALQNRVIVANALRGHHESSLGGQSLRVLRARLADIWHIIAILYIVGVYIVLALDISGGVDYLLHASLITLAVLAAAKLATMALRSTVARGFALSDDLRQRFPQLEGRANRYLPILQAVLRITIYVIATLAILGSWGVDTFGWFTTDAGGRFLHALISISLVLLGALILWEIISSMIERYLEKLANAEMIAASARLRTLLPLMRQTLFVVLAVVVTMIILSELGLNIGPLLAAAGVVGLAIGFGAQTLVKDVITGLFILVENQMSVGDVVNLGGNSGVVEGITIRTVRLRDLSGTVHIIPFNEVGKILNLTKDFSYYLLEIGVAYREDTDQVIDVCGSIVDELRQDSEYAPFILEPLDVLGVDKFDDSAVIIKARIKTVPSKQWFVGREFNRRMKKKFDALDIEIPFPHQTIYFGVDKEGGAPPARIAMTPAQKGDDTA